MCFRFIFFLLSLRWWMIADGTQQFYSLFNFKFSDWHSVNVFAIKQVLQLYWLHSQFEILLNSLLYENEQMKIISNNKTQWIGVWKEVWWLIVWLRQIQNTKTENRFRLLLLLLFRSGIDLDVKCGGFELNNCGLGCFWLCAK